MITNFNIRLSQAGERTCGFVDRSLDIFQSEEKKEIRMKKGDESLCE